MWRKILAVAAMVAFIIIPSTGSTWVSVWETCQQTDLEGTWTIVISINDADCPGNSALRSTQVEIDSDGVIRNTGATIENMCRTSIITGGQLALMADCIIEGHIETSDGTLDVAQGGTIVPEEICMVSADML